jgi:nitrogen regulatory protein P-II 1
MKMIKCFIRHERLEEVRGKLFELGAPGISVTEAKGIGKPMSQLKSSSESKLPQFLPRVEVSIVVEDDAVDELVDTLVNTLRTGQFGDGKIFILPVEDAVRIRTGERGGQALY